MFPPAPIFPVPALTILDDPLFRYMPRLLEPTVTSDESSFVSLVFIEGSGTIEADDYKQEVPFKAGESFFVSSGKRSINIKGKGTCIVTHV